MTRIPLLITLAAAAALAGCNSESHTIVAGGNEDDTNTVAHAPVALPPSIASQKVYRCADNEIVHVDWLSDNKSANIRTEKNATPTQVTAAQPGQPMTGPNGTSLEGSASAKSVKVALPGHAAQTCNA